MEQTILFCVLALALCQTVFLLNHRYLLRGAIFFCCHRCRLPGCPIVPVPGSRTLPHHIRYGCQRCLWNAGLHFSFAD